MILTQVLGKTGTSNVGRPASRVEGQSPAPAGGIRLVNVNKTFEGLNVQVKALKPLSLTVVDGEFVSIIGPSGCGKSTLLRIIAGLIRPSYGQVLIDGVEVDRPIGKVGLVFQAPVLLKWKTVLRNVLFPYQELARQGRATGSKEQYEARAKALLEMAGLSEFEDAYPKELSGGMQQRVAICRALIHDPQVLLMDEPFGALDELNRERMNKELARIWEETKKTVVFVTHNIGEAVYLSDRVVVMRERPGDIREIVPINLDRPRSPDVADTRDFLDHVVRVRHLLAGDQSEG